MLHMHDAIKRTHPNTPWKLITGMRHYMVHGYYQIDKDVVWNVVTSDLIPLAKQIEEYLLENSAKV